MYFIQLLYIHVLPEECYVSHCSFILVRSSAVWKLYLELISNCLTCFGCWWLLRIYRLLVLLFQKSWRCGHLWRRCVNFVGRLSVEDESMCYAQPTLSTNRDRACQHLQMKSHLIRRMCSLFPGFELPCGLDKLSTHAWLYFREITV